MPDKKLIRDTFTELWMGYNGSDRFYHNINHINDGLDHFDKIRHLADDPNSLEMAWWWHNFVYSAKSSANELHSAINARNFLRMLGTKYLFRNKVYDRILATKHDCAPAEHDSRLIIDIDLVSLATPPKVFDQNTANIRRENQHLTDEEFTTNSANFLRKFLESRPSIYLTEYFRDKYEAQAQENLRRITS